MLGEKMEYNHGATEKNHVFGTKTFIMHVFSRLLSRMSNPLNFNSMNPKTKVGLVFAAGLLITFGGMAAALAYANKLIKKETEPDSTPGSGSGPVNAEEPENVKAETVNDNA